MLRACDHGSVLAGNTKGNSDRAFFNAGDTATIQSSSFGDGVRVTMDMLNQAFLKGMEEANKFLPATTTTIFGLGATPREHLPGPRDGSMLPRAFPLANTNSVVDSRGCKNRHSWDDLDDDAETGRRSNKLLAPEPEENGEQVDDVFVKGYELAMEKMHGLSISTNNGSASDGKAIEEKVSRADQRGGGPTHPAHPLRGGRVHGRPPQRDRAAPADQAAVLAEGRRLAEAGALFR